MSAIDYVVLGIVVLSAGIGVWRGFVREALSLAIWILAFWLAYVGAAVIEIYFQDVFVDQSLRLVVSFVILFLGVHIAGFIISRLLSTLIKSIGLKGVDRVAGGAFGIVRGVVVISVLVLIAGLTPVAEETFWRDSFMIGVTENVLDWVQKHYPLETVSENLANMAIFRS